MLASLWKWMKAEHTREAGDPRAPLRIFWVALAIRVLYITLAHTYRFRPLLDHFQFGWEAGRLGRSIATGHGFADPYGNSVLGPSGPTACIPPLYPLLIASVFKLFGVYTPASAWVLLAINSVLSAATALAVWEIGFRCFSRRNAVWAAWLWVLYPAAMQYAIRWLWEMSLTNALFTWVIVLALRIRGINVNSTLAPNPTTHAIESASAQSLRWIAFGLLWGMIALSNASLLLFLPACGLWVLIGIWRRPHALRDAALAGLTFLACLAPWEFRNYTVFHTFVPIRGDFGLEAYLGNGPDSNGLLMSYHHPNSAIDQFHLYVAMGEVRYSAMHGALASAYIHAHPAHFLANCIKRAYYFWVGVPHDAPWQLEFIRILNYSFITLAGLLGLVLALRRRVPGSGLFACAFLFVPIPYYAVMAMARFRHPIEPLLTILGVYLFQSATPRKPTTYAGEHSA